MTRKTAVLIAAGASLFSLGAAAHHAAANRWPATFAGQPAPKMEGVPKELQKTLENFDDLDFRVFSGQQWQDVHLSHADDVKVIYADGSATYGLARHIEDLKSLFTFAPDFHVTEHEVRFGTHDAEWTATLSWVEGTFTQPLDTGDGSPPIPPTGKHFRYPLITLGHWGQDHLMHEEYIFSDGVNFFNQLGL